ncbi:MAG: purine-binding chemotaxis protein CheW [Nitrospirae bacterium]|nr:MAG: purine-binding chemotaxis protein CheW [Nitrospirota bacterium]
MAETTDTPTALSGKVLTFRLGEETFGIAIAAVREIVSLQPMTPLPDAPHHVRGVIDLRGRFIPVVDLRLRLGRGSGEETEATCIVVLQLHGTTLGVVVDAVEDVMDVEAERVEPPPPRWAGGSAGYLLGMTRAGERPVVLVEMERVFPADEVAALGGGDFPL